jgi:protein-tyrosine kinase
MNKMANTVLQDVSQKPDTKMGRLLLESGKISSADFKLIMDTQALRGLRFGDAALELGLANTADIKAILAQQFAYPGIPDSNSKLDKRLFTAFRPDSLQTEALRSLRSELQLRYFNQGTHLSLALVGASDALGVAVTSANLAITFAQLGLRTLLVDSNLRSPQLHALFGLSERHPGLADLISGRVLVEPKAIPEVGSLWLLPAGTEAPNPQELIASPNYSRRITELSESFDVILLNTAPLNRTLDAQLVAAHAGAALLVVQEDISRLKDVANICHNLRGFGIRLLGAALRQI